MHTLLRRFRLAWSVACTGRTPGDKVLMLAWSLYCYVQYQSNLPYLSIRPWVLIHEKPYRIELRSLSDLWVFKDVLVDREYERVNLTDPHTIVDLGCNIGISTLYFSARYPKAHIYAIEPNPHLMPQLRFNLTGVPNISIHPFALAGSDGPVTLAVGKQTASGSLVTHMKGEESVTVEGVHVNRLREVLDSGPIDLLKFDIEGAEQYIFKGGKDFTSIGAYIGEMHYDLADVTPAEVTAAFTQYAFQEFPIRKDRSIVYAVRRNI